MLFKKRRKRRNKNESYDFFPFTHGEQVESIRADQKRQARIELKERLQDQHIRTRQNMMSQSFYNHFSPLASLEGSRESLEERAASIENSRQNKGKSCFDTNLGWIPKFMQPAKFYPYRRIRDHHVKKVMRDAIKKVEEDIIQQKNQALSGNLCFSFCYLQLLTNFKMKGYCYKIDF